MLSKERLREFIELESSKDQLEFALNDLMSEAYEMINIKAISKGYKGMYFLTGREHAIGEIYLKIARYQNTNNPEDLVKILGWLSLLYRDNLRVVALNPEKDLLWDQEKIYESGTKI